MCYVCLLQLKGKAAIDVICNPLGKSGGALIQQFMIVAFGSLAASTPYLGVILLGVIIVWIKSANSLNKQFVGAFHFPPELIGCLSFTQAVCNSSVQCGA